MSVELGSLNWLAVVAAVVACIVIAFVWYMPPLFGAAWASRNARYTGMTVDELVRPKPDLMLRQLGLWAIGFAVNAAVFALFLRALGITETGGAILLGVTAWLAWAATLSSWPVIFARQPVGVWAINNGAHLVMQVVMAVILTAWR